MMSYGHDQFIYENVHWGQTDLSVVSEALTGNDQCQLLTSDVTSYEGLGTCPPEACTRIGNFYLRLTPVGSARLPVNIRH